jgi:K+-sensing histidine kinase KdpD
MTKSSNTSNVITLPQHERDILGENWAKLVRQILHDLTTPLMGVGFNASSIKENLDTLVQAYKQATKHGLVKKPLRPDKLQQLETGITSISNEAKALNSFINQFSPLCRKITDKPDNQKQQAIKTFLEDFLISYPFKEPIQRELLRLNISSNFSVTAEVFFLKHLMSRLLEHLLEARQDNQNSSKAEITTVEEDQYYVLLFNAMGDSDDNSAPITDLIRDDRFFTKSKDGTVLPGILFCKLAFEQHGGQINYATSVDGNQEKVTFTVKFAKQ